MHAIFFLEKHGKNVRDGHFGQVMHAIDLAAKEMDIITIADVKTALSRLNNTIIVIDHTLPKILKTRPGADKSKNAEPGPSPT